MRHSSALLRTLLLLTVTMSLAGQVEVSADVADTIGNFVAGPMRKPHPAIVQVLAHDNEGIAKGSGSLVYADAKFGYILTNWHVVRDGIEIDVKFPDGFSSSGTTVKTDENWDLALVRIWKPQARPLLVAAVVPAPGDVLTIAGYGQDKFRAARGKCIHYAAPDANRPFEMVEVSVEARQGDSGGPILNHRGELAGVLFGAGDGATTGSHIGRVKTFLDATFLEQQQLAQAGSTPAPDQIARRQPPPPFVPQGSDSPRRSDVIPKPNANQKLFDVPSQVAGVGDGPAAHAPIAQLGKPEPIPKIGRQRQDFGGAENVAQKLRSNPPSNESPVQGYASASARRRLNDTTQRVAERSLVSRQPMPDADTPSANPARPLANRNAPEPTVQVPDQLPEQLPIGPDQFASNDKASVQLPILNVPAVTPNQANRRFGSGFTLDRSFLEKLFEATKSVFAIIGAMAVIVQFAKSSLRKKAA